MSTFGDEFESYAGPEPNYFDTFSGENKKTKTFFENYKPLSDSTELKQDSFNLADEELQIAVKSFQDVAMKAGIELALGQVRIKELKEEEKTLKGYPDDVIKIKTKPLGQHRDERDSDGSFIDIDWKYIRNQKDKDAVSVFVVVLTHEYMHEKMKTDKNIFGQEDAYYVQKEEALANVLTLKALHLFGDASLFDFAKQFMIEQPQEMGYRYGIKIYRQQEDKTITDLAEKWKKEKEGEINKPTTEEKTDFYRAVMKGLKE